MKKPLAMLLFTLLLFTPLAFAQEGIITDGNKQMDNKTISGGGAKILSFKYRKGETYRILSKVHEDAYKNKRRINHSEIVNRISINVLDAKADGTGTLYGTYMTTENSTLAAQGLGHGDVALQGGETFTYGEEYISRFDRAKNGRYTISDEYFMPIVRDNPIFPETPVSVGDAWQAKGYEAEDFRRLFGMQKPFKVPFTAKYKYVDVTQSLDGRELDVIDVKYDFRYNSPPPVAGATASDLETYPALTTGYSYETLYWDNVRGEIDHYIEDFKIEIETFYGDIYVFQGIAEAEVVEVKKTNTADKIEEVKETIESLSLENVNVKQGEKGLTISIEQIQFLPDSAVLQESEKEKIQKIANVLRGFNNDLLVTGYCALRGSAEQRQIISDGRAKSVGDYLVELGVRDAYRIFTQGKGARDAIATNDTEEGRALNRRVEITLMD